MSFSVEEETEIMAILKCKMCGGDLNIAEGVSVCECEYCGTKQTVPMVDDEKKITLFARANRLRFGSEFDKAAGVYEAIVADFPEEAEAYWGLVLCQYGIEYVDDPATGKKIPTCHRSSFDSVMDDNNFDLTLEYADPTARGVYREEAKRIEELRRNIIAVSSKEEPYDIFICYKETDDKGERTIDSVIAQDVYTALTEKGYRVFFSRISLEDKLGVEYEPYIFAALHSAKVMLAFGTDYEYYNAVWVKNEWSRFLQLIEKGEKKALIPCYKGIDAYDMPKEFAKLQAQDMGKVGAMQDLLRGVEKIVPLHSAPATAAPAVVAHNTAQLMLAGDVMFEGEVFANIPHGYGKATYANGNIYEGEWNRGKRNGHGVFRCAAFVYDGQWMMDQKQGHGKITWAGGGEWVGEFRDDRPWTGRGITNHENGRYEAEMVNGLYHGQGTLTLANGNRYEGAWLNGKKQGQGKMLWADSTAWTGEFRDDKPYSGNGVWHFADHTYEGTLTCGTKQGQGKITWQDGGVWVGTFQDDKPWNGEGSYFYEDGCYIGALADGKRHGHGVYLWNDGDRYEGEWINDKRHGQSKMIWAQGGEWVGEFQNDRYWNGEGTMYFTDGSSDIVTTKRGIHK